MATPAHRKQDEGGVKTRRPLSRVAVAVAAAVVIAAAGVTAAVVLTTRHANTTQLTGTRGGRTGSGSTVSRSSSSGSSSTSSTTLAPVPLSVRSLTPAPAAKGVATNRTISITFSHALAADTPAPTLSPPILGAWSREGPSLVFHPTAGYIPSTKVTVTVPASARALEGNRAVMLGHPYQLSFSVGTGSVLRLQQVLAELGYLPLSFDRASATTPASSSARTAPAASPKASHAATTTALVSNGALNSEPAAADAVSTVPEPGHFAWKYGNVPAQLQAQWQVGQYNLITKGAVMAFEADHGLGVDGVAGPEVWTSVLRAVAVRQADRRPYDYITVNEEGTEYLRVWQNGGIVSTSLTNTGVPGAATQRGTYAVETHLPTNWMTGTDVNGSHYHVQVYFAAYFNGGDAIHAYPRASYGSPQSNGCVELNYTNAEALFNSGQDWYGTLVTVS